MSLSPVFSFPFYSVVLSSLSQSVMLSQSVPCFFTISLNLCHSHSLLLYTGLRTLVSTLCVAISQSVALSQSVPASVKVFKIYCFESLENVFLPCSL